MRSSLFRKFAQSIWITTFVKPQSGRNLSDFIEKIFICVPKMNGSLTGLERHEGE